MTETLQQGVPRGRPHVLNSAWQLSLSELASDSRAGLTPQIGKGSRGHVCPCAMTRGSSRQCAFLKDSGNRCLDIMTSDGSADLRCHRGRACQKPEPPQVETCHNLGDQPCISQAPSTSVWMSIKRRLPWPTWPKAHDAEVVYLGTIGTRQCDIDTRIRTRQAKRKHRVFVYEAGPCHSGLYRYRTQKGYIGWVIAPRFFPKRLGAA
jgi:hypothetical protein